jgi:transposase
VDRDHPSGDVLADRRALQPRAVQRADRHRVSRDRGLGPLERLQPSGPTRRQACWSHIKRDFRRHADGLGEQKTFGEHGVVLTHQLFAAWRAYQHEHHDRQRLATEIAPIQTQLRELLEQASPKRPRNRWHRQFANNLLKIWPALWTFVTVEGIEPTNNPAERALRAPVIHRKVSLGTQTAGGERFAERALSAAGTCRQQRRSLFSYLSELLVAHTRGDPFPALAT